jgi:integrase
VQTNRELAVLKRIFHRCQDWNLFEDDNPVYKVRLVKEPRRRLHYLEPEEEHRLLGAAPEPLRTIILVGIHCGLRLHSEALMLRWSDEDLACHTLTVQGGYNKSGQTRIVPFNSAMSASLTRLKVQAMSEFVFTTLTGKPYDSALGLSRLAPAPVWKASPRTQPDIHSRRDLSTTKLICEPCKSWADGRAYDC